MWLHKMMISYVQAQKKPKKKKSTQRESSLVLWYDIEARILRSSSVL
jgi:hypothetical protein